jgi:hypothetical protein
VCFILYRPWRWTQETKESRKLTAQSCIFLVLAQTPVVTVEFSPRTSSLQQGNGVTYHKLTSPPGDVARLRFLPLPSLYLPAIKYLTQGLAVWNSVSRGYSAHLPNVDTAACTSSYELRSRPLRRQVASTPKHQTIKQLNIVACLNHIYLRQPLVSKQNFVFVRSAIDNVGVFCVRYQKERYIAELSKWGASVFLREFHKLSSKLSNPLSYVHTNLQLNARTIFCTSK